jgi:hypothetical protein
MKPSLVHSYSVQLLSGQPQGLSVNGDATTPNRRNMMSSMSDAALNPTSK